MEGQADSALGDARAEGGANSATPAASASITSAWTANGNRQVFDGRAGRQIRVGVGHAIQRLKLRRLHSALFWDAPNNDRRLWDEGLSATNRRFQSGWFVCHIGDQRCADPEITNGDHTCMPSRAAAALVPSGSKPAGISVKGAKLNVVPNHSMQKVVL